MTDDVRLFEPYFDLKSITPMLFFQVSHEGTMEERVFVLHYQGSQQLSPPYLSC